MDFPNYRTQFNQNRKEGGRLREGRREGGREGEKKRREILWSSRVTKSKDQVSLNLSFERESGPRS